MSKGEATRERIIDCAIRLASVEGLNGLSIGQLAEAVGMSKSGLFAHFRSKDELQVQVLEGAVERFRMEVVEPARATPSGEERFRVALDRWLAWVEDQEAMPGGCLFAQASTELDDRPGPARDRLVEAQLGWIETLTAFARSAMKIGAFREDLDPRRFAFQFLAIALATNHFGRLLRDPAARELARASLEALLASSRTPTST